MASDVESIEVLAAERARCKLSRADIEELIGIFRDGRDQLEALLLSELLDDVQDGGGASEVFPAGFKSESEFAGWLSDRAGDEWTAQDDWNFGARDIYSVALFCEEAQDPDYIEGITRYFFEGEFASEQYGVSTDHPCSDGRGHLFFVNTDFTKCRHDDWGDYIGGLWTILREGTPVRKTNRAGAGTKGTRKYEGIQGKFWVCFG